MPVTAEPAFELHSRRSYLPKFKGGREITLKDKLVFKSPGKLTYMKDGKEFTRFGAFCIQFKEECLRDSLSLSLSL